MGISLLIGFGMLVPASSSAVEIHAHRGGANVEGKATFPENSMAGFEHSLDEGYTIELDLQPTSDGAAVVMHDEDLDRTTNCTGAVDDHTLAQLASCRIDQLGSEDVAEQLPPGDPRLEPIPRFTQVIDLLEKTGGRANIEVKDLPGEHPDFPPDTYRQLEASDIPSSRIIVQNFKSSDLLQAPTLYPGVATSLLSIGALNDSYLIQTASANDFDWVSPQWPISAEFVTRAREAGMKIVPYTIDDAADMKAAAALGVDALITNDPALADRLVGPKPDLSLKIIAGKTRIRPGKTARFTARITNSGEGESDAVRLKVGVGASGLKPNQGDRTISPIPAGRSRNLKVTLKARAKTRKFGRFPIVFRLSQTGKPIAKKIKKVRIIQSRFAS